MKGKLGRGGGGGGHETQLFVIVMQNIIWKISGENFSLYKEQHLNVILLV